MSDDRQGSLTRAVERLAPKPLLLGALKTGWFPSMGVFFPVMLCSMLCLVLTVRADDDTTATEQPDPAEAGDVAIGEEPSLANPRPNVIKPRMGGRLRLEYDYQKQGEATDSDVNGRLFAYGYDLNNGTLDLYTSMRLYHDLDEASSYSFDEDPYLGLNDADGVTENRVMQAYADIHKRDKSMALRLGRQYIDISDYIQMDGGQFLLNENRRFGGRVYFGHPVSYYTSVSGDYAGGLSLVGRPLEGNISRVTFAQYHDDSVDDADRHYFLDVRQKFSDTSRARAQTSVLNEEYRMARMDYYYYAEDGGTDVSAGASYWGSFDAATRVYSPLYNVLGEQDPYTYTYARLTRKLVEDWFVSPGVSLRFAEEGDNAYNNRDYERYDLTLIYEPNRAFNASMAVEYWSVEEGDSFAGLSGDIRYRYGKIWEVSGGAAFAEYSYDTFSDLNYTVSGGRAIFSDSGTVIKESPFVYTYYLRGRWRITRMLTLRLQGDIEDNDEVDKLAYRARGSVEVKF